MATTTLTVTARDSAGNPLAGKPVSLSVSGTGNTLTSASGTTNASGVFTATLASTRAEAKTVSASVSPLNLVTSVTFTAGPPSATRSSLVASPGSAEANGTSTSTLTLTVRDSNDNPINGQAVSLAVSGTGNTLTPTSGSTNASGNFTATLASTVVETKTVTATAGAVSLDTTVNFTPAASAANSALVAGPDTVLADGVAASTLTVTVRDASNNPIPGYGVSLSSTGTQNFFSPASGVTDSGGVFQAGLASTRAETKTVTATLGASTLNASVTFTPGPAVGATSTITGSPSAAIADGVATITLTVTARDANGNTVPGQAVEITATGTNNTFSPEPPHGTTDAGGAFSATLASSTSETKTVSALINGAFSVSTEVTFGASLLLLAADIGESALNSLKTRMEATGAFTRVDIFNAYTGTPTLTQLQGYSSVLFWTNYHLADKVRLGNNLADYFDSGGRVVIATFGYLSSSSWPNNNVAGRWLADGYNLFELGGQASSSASLGTVVEPSSPLMSGVNTLSGGTIHVGTGAVTNGGVVVAYWSTGRPLVVRGTVNGRNRVDLELYPPAYWTGDGVALMRNALLY
ncbi:MAG: Ig-like domain-containing protein [Myxococcota bacterium]|nr:Ig-like domain-containing protein [Myxococcota bacterium]